ERPTGARRGVVEGREQAVHGPRRRRRRLPPPPGRAVGHEAVRERAADVDADGIGGHEARDDTRRSARLARRRSSCPADASMYRSRDQTRLGRDRKMTPDAPPPASSVDADVDAAAVRAAYQTEHARVVRQRLGVTVFLFGLLVGTSVVTEHLFHPARGPTIVAVYAIEMVACAAALIACRLPRLRDHPVPIAAALAALLSVSMSAYNGIVHGPIERYATAQVCLLSGLLVILPWGWGAQLAVSVVALLS